MKSIDFKEIKTLLAPRSITTIAKMAKIYPKRVYDIFWGFETGSTKKQSAKILKAVKKHYLQEIERVQKLGEILETFTEETDVIKKAAEYISSGVILKIATETNTSYFIVYAMTKGARNPVTLERYDVILKAFNAHYLEEVERLKKLDLILKDC